MPRQVCCPSCRSCGTSGCHEQVYAEWQPSAHRFSAMNPSFQAIQKNFAADRGAEETRYCAGCHDPISLFAGAKDIHNLSLSAPGMQEGCSCVVCHALDKVGVRGNADYDRGLMHSPEFCGACHKQFIPEALNRFGLVAGQNQYDAWHSSHWNTTAPATNLNCIDCHMRLVHDSRDPARGRQEPFAARLRMVLTDTTVSSRRTSSCRKCSSCRMRTNRCD